MQRQRLSEIVPSLQPSVLLAPFLTGFNQRDPHSLLRQLRDGGDVRAISDESSRLNAVRWVRRFIQIKAELNKELGALQNYLENDAARYADLKRAFDAQNKGPHWMQKMVPEKIGRLIPWLQSDGSDSQDVSNLEMGTDGTIFVRHSSNSVEPFYDPVRVQAKIEAYSGFIATIDDMLRSADPERKIKIEPAGQTQPLVKVPTMVEPGVDLTSASPRTIIIPPSED